MPPALEKAIQQFKASEHRFMMLVALVIGLLGGLGAVLFRLLIRLMQRIAYGPEPYSVGLFDHLAWWHVVMVPVIGGVLIAPIIFHFARETRGHGVPEVMEAVALKHGAIRKRIAAAKIVVSAITIGSGGSVGREGPIVQIGSAIGSTLGQLLHVSRSRLRTMVGCGSAAGIAATFNAPMAGVLFALEIILGDFGVRRFTPIVISSVIATAVSHKFLGNTTAFGSAMKYNMVSSVELVTYSLLGVAAGVVGMIFTRAVYGAEDLFEKLKAPRMAKPAIAGLLIGLIGLRYPHIFGVGYETIESALRNELTWQLLFVLIAMKLLATSITLGAGGSGGIFAPSLFIGAVLGGSLGNVFHIIMPDHTAGPGAYAMVGMGALVAAATHAPLTSIMIIFEMTNDYKIILPLMFACIIANAISSRLEPESIYTMKLARRGVNLSAGQEINVLSSLRVGSVISSKYHTIGVDTPLGDLMQQVVRHPYAYFYVTDGEGGYKGVVAVDDLRQVILHGDMLANLVIAGDIMNQDVPTVSVDDTLDKVMLLFGRRNREELPVVQYENGRRMMGVVTRHALITAYNNEIMKRDTVGGMALRIGSVGERRPVVLSSGIVIARKEAPGWMVGRTLKDLKLRERWGIQVVTVQPSQESPSAPEPPQLVPGPETVIKLGDSLLLLGPKEGLDKVDV